MLIHFKNKKNLCYQSYFKPQLLYLLSTKLMKLKRFLMGHILQSPESDHFVMQNGTNSIFCCISDVSFIVGKESGLRIREIFFWVSSNPSKNMSSSIRSAHLSFKSFTWYMGNCKAGNQTM